MQATPVKPALNEQPQCQGYVLDEHGQEHPITEAMIQQACHELERALSQLSQTEPALTAEQSAP